MNASHFLADAIPAGTPTSWNVITILVSVYIGLIVCWAAYWMLFGISEKSRHADRLAILYRARIQQKEIIELRQEVKRFRDAAASTRLELDSLRQQIDELTARVPSEPIRVSDLDWESIAEPPVNSLRVAATETAQIKAARCDPNLLDRGRHDPNRGRVYDSPPSRPDDLTGIWGIGEVNQARLRENGIYFLEQIADWDDRNVEHYDQLLSFKGRISRENWVGQASHLLKKKMSQAA